MRFHSGDLMNSTTIKCYGAAIRFGSKYVYQTVPRLLTLWLDMGTRNIDSEEIKALSDWVWKAFRTSAKYKVGLAGDAYPPPR